MNIHQSKNPNPIYVDNNDRRMPGLFILLLIILSIMVISLISPFVGGVILLLSISLWPLTLLLGATVLTRNNKGSANPATMTDMYKWATYKVLKQRENPWAGPTTSYDPEYLRNYYEN